MRRELTLSEIAEVMRDVTRRNQCGAYPDATGALFEVTVELARKLPKTEQDAFVTQCNPNRVMRCTCEDVYCRVCGPAQGNHQCPICEGWSIDGGCPAPDECRARVERFADYRRITR
jgi:hypothetical protein